MSWLAQNWIWVVVAIGIAWFFLRSGRAHGHAGGAGGLLEAFGGHGGHGSHGHSQSAQPANPPQPAVDPVSGETVTAAQALRPPRRRGMEHEYHTLSIRELDAGAGMRRPAQAQAARVTLESSALEVMTDLTRVSPATIGPQAPLAGANRFMITRGVRLLLVVVVVDDEERVVGVITASDILGERPMLAVTKRGLRRDELTVADVMTPVERVEAIAYADAAGAHVGHVLETLRRTGRQHVLVVDYDALPPPAPLAPPVMRAMVRGIFSISQVARQLGVTLPPGTEVARTFSEIEAALGR